MAKISIEFDTNTKALTASIDGKAVENARCVDIYPSYDDPDEYRCVIMTASKDEESDITTVTQLVACETVLAKALTAEHKADESAFPGFVKAAAAKVSKTLADIANYFSVN